MEAKVYVHSTGRQDVDVIDHNGEDMSLVVFKDSGATAWVCDSDLWPVGLLCEDVCPGHHERYGAGENLRTAINWCPGVERADTQEVMWSEPEDEW